LKNIFDKIIGGQPIQVQEDFRMLKRQDKTNPRNKIVKTSRMQNKEKYQKLQKSIKNCKPEATSYI
jgi:hypothetical protein